MVLHNPRHPHNAWGQWRMSVYGPPIRRGSPAMERRTGRGLGRKRVSRHTGREGRPQVQPGPGTLLKAIVAAALILTPSTHPRTNIHTRPLPPATTHPHTARLHPTRPTFHPYHPQAPQPLWPCGLSPRTQMVDEVLLAHAAAAVDQRECLGLLVRDELHRSSRAGAAQTTRTLHGLSDTMYAVLWRPPAACMGYRAPSSRA